MFGLVLLAGGAFADEVLNSSPEVGDVEVTAQPMQRVLDALVVILMDRGDDLRQQRRRRRNVEAGVVGDKAVDDGPRRQALARGDLLLKRDQGWVRGLGLAELVDEVEARD